MSEGLPDEWPTGSAEWVYLPNAEPGWVHYRHGTFRLAEQQPRWCPRTDRLSMLLRWLGVRDRQVWREPTRIVATGDEEFRIYLDGPGHGDPT